jgi:hypothetical protein
MVKNETLSVINLSLKLQWLALLINRLKLFKFFLDGLLLVLLSLQLGLECLDLLGLHDLAALRLLILALQLVDLLLQTLVLLP